METKVSIKTSDDHIIYGTLNSPENKTDKLVIFVHGFTGNCEEHIFFNGAKFLKSKGIASFRFDLYNWQEKGRIFMDCDTQTHVDDLKTVFNHFKNQFSKIYLVGHSWGGVVVLDSKLDAAGIILWDPSHCSSNWEGDYTYVESLDSYLLNWGVVFVVGKKMYKDTLECKKADDLILGNDSAIKVICAGKGELIEGGKEYIGLAKGLKAFVIIEGAGHTFDEEGTEDKLFKETINWINS